MGSGGKLAHPPAPLRGRQLRADHLLDQRVPEQRDLPRPLQPPPLIRFLLQSSLPVLLADARGRGPTEGDSSVTPSHERELALNARAAITGAIKVAFVTADAISHGDTVSSSGHRPAAAAAAAATATSASASGDPAGSSGTGSALSRGRHPREDLPDLPGPPGGPAQPAPHRVLRHPQLPGRPAMPLPARRRRQRRPDHRRLIHPPQQQPRGQQHMRHPARRAPRPARPHHPALSAAPARTPPAAGHAPTGPAAPRTQGRTNRPLPASARRARRRCLP